MSLTAIILAAGQSTRMKSSLPKALHEVCGRPMLHYVLQACYGAGCSRVIVVVGHGKEQLISAFSSDSRIHWVEQTERLGTGHAAKVCIPELQKIQGDVFILAGDGPLIRAEVLKTLHNAHVDDRAAGSLATAVIDNPYGYGRIVRDDAGEFLQIVEESDATPDQRDIHEVFPSYYCFRSHDLIEALGQLKNDNKKSEYYLTDVYAILRQSGKRVLAVQAVAAEDTLSINTRQQLAEVDAIMQDRIQRTLREAGVTIVSPANTYIESNVTIGRDSLIHPFSFIGRDSEIGARSTIGPFGLIPRSSLIPEGAVIAGNISPSNAILTTTP
ncbi:MAG TPA: NTP transferase domain-containing protein [Tepidisphaeraceae bacterium]|jgi:bifunctional UDP-N-acetylglucosamine pyrophosphorylase/glucosamine-1-phosphate N-acetyltransferase|nr:NTP transferase domain-containing protein [Tepidisphaeraceae bacterium]